MYCSMFRHVFSNCYFNISLYIVHVNAYKRESDGRLVLKNGLPSLNEELTYLLTYLSIWEIIKLAEHWPDSA